jgi:hypothetical protein
MRRRTVLAAAALLTFALVAPTGAQEQTGISGQVESVLELSLVEGSAGVEATVSATVAHTQLSVTKSGRGPRVLKAYREPVTRQRASVPRATVTQTITFGPQSP